MSNYPFKYIYFVNERWTIISFTCKVLNKPPQKKGEFTMRCLVTSRTCWRGLGRESL